MEFRPCFKSMKFRGKNTISNLSNFFQDGGSLLKASGNIVTNSNLS